MKPQQDELDAEARVMDALEGEEVIDLLDDDVDAKMADLSGLRVVIAEDDDDARELMIEVLLGCGAEVWSADCADDAIDLVRDERPDVLVSDIGLPGKDGYALIRAVRALGADAGGRVPAIALTAYSALEDSRNALRAGYQVHVAKPIDPSLLTHAVANVAGLPIVDFAR